MIIQTNTLVPTIKAGSVLPVFQAPNTSQAANVADIVSVSVFAKRSSNGLMARDLPTRMNSPNPVATLPQVAIIGKSK